MTLSVTVIADEVLVRLDAVPANIKASLRAKFGDLFAELISHFVEGIPGRYLDPKFFEVGVEDQGDLTIGFLQVNEKPGVYTILPLKGNVLRFISKSGERVFARQVTQHPYLRGAPHVRRYFEQNKPWLIHGMEQAVREGLAKK